MAQNKRSSYIIEIFTSTARDKYFYPSVFFLPKLIQSVLKVAIFTNKYHDHDRVLLVLIIIV